MATRHQTRRECTQPGANDGSKHDSAEDSALVLCALDAMSRTSHPASSGGGASGAASPRTCTARQQVPRTSFQTACVRRRGRWTPRPRRRRRSPRRPTCPGEPPCAHAAAARAAPWPRASCACHPLAPGHATLHHGSSQRALSAAIKPTRPRPLRRPRPCRIEAMRTRAAVRCVRAATCRGQGRW